TIPEGIPREHYERITYAYAERAKIEHYVNGKADEPGRSGDDAEVAALAKDILSAIEGEPLYYTDIAERFASYNFRTVARALGHLHASEKLWQDSRGRMCVRGSQFAAKPPGKGRTASSRENDHPRAQAGVRRPADPAVRGPRTCDRSRALLRRPRGGALD